MIIINIKIVKIFPFLFILFTTLPITTPAKITINKYRNGTNLIFSTISIGNNAKNNDENIAEAKNRSFFIPFLAPLNMPTNATKKKIINSFGTRVENSLTGQCIVTVTRFRSSANGIDQKAVKKNPKRYTFDK